MSKKAICKELDEQSLKKEVINLFNKEWGKGHDGNDWFNKDYFKIRSADIDTNNVIHLAITLKWNWNGRPSPAQVEITFDKDLSEDAGDDDYVINIVDLMKKLYSPKFNEDTNTYKVKGSLKEGKLYCCR